MITQDFNYLKFIPLINFDLWDTKRYTVDKITSKYEIVKLGSCIKEENKKYKLNLQEEKEFGILGVNNKTGIFDAYAAKGKDINQAYKKMEVGWLAYNPYRINVGSIGVRTVEHKNEYISPAYVVFSCLKNLLPEYLYLLFKTETFNKVINENTTGSVRQNLTIEILKSLEIPLPSINEQKQIVDNYNVKQQQANDLKKQATDTYQELESYLFEELGISKEKKEKKEKRLFQLVKFTDISRWDTLFLLDNSKGFNAKFNLVKFSDVITFFNKSEYHNSIRIDSSKYPNDDFKYIGMEHVEKETGNLLELLDVKGADIKSQTLRVPKKYFIYGKLRPYLNKYWINETDFENIICSSEFFVFDIDEKINKIFFKYVLASKLIQDQISDKTSGARMPRINEDIFVNLKFPLPPIKKQDEIADTILKKNNKIKKYKTDSAELILKANLEFEQAIFN